MFKTSIPLVICSLLALAVVMPATAQTPILIGQSLPLTGPQATFGKSVREGTEALVEMINRGGGINGKPLALKVLDDEFNPAKTVANLKALAEVDGAVAISSMVGGPNVLAAMPVAFALNIPIFGVLNGNAALRPQNGSTIVHVRVPFVREMETIVSQYVTIGIKSFAVFAPDDSAGRVAAKGVKDVLAATNLSPPTDIAFARDAKDFTAYAQQLAASKSEVLIVFAPTGAAANMITAVKRIAPGVKIVCVSVVDERGLYGLLKEEARGVVFSSVVPNPYSVNLGLTRQYQQAMKESGGKQLSLASYEAFINAKVLVEALRRSGSVPNRASLRKAFGEMPPVDLGEVSYRPNATANSAAGINVVDIVMLARDGRLVR